MRQIKFRGWSKQSKQMYTLVYGTFHLVSLDRGKTASMQWTDGEYPEPVFDLEIMQFTGLHDKNGKEIWEGDRITIDASNKPYNAMVCEVLWKENDARWVFKQIGFNFFFHPGTYPVEVLGNVYENQELLKP